MAVVAYDVRLGAPKLYPLEALKLGIGAPVAKPRAALGAAHTAANAVLRHDKIVGEEIGLGFKRNAALPLICGGTAHYRN